MNSPISLAAARPATLALALLSLMACLPAHAGLPCELADGDLITETTGFSSATGSEAVACGVLNRASGDQSVAFGFTSTAFAQGSIAIGSWLDVDGDTLIQPFDIDTDGDNIMDASSELTFASGANAIAIGAATRATGIQALAVGTSNVADGNFTIAVGHGNTASGGTAVGFGNTASGSESTAVGNKNMASGSSSSAVGRSNTASGFASTAVGHGNTASGFISTAVGVNNTASGFASSAFGLRSTAGGDNSIALGGFVDFNNNGFADLDTDTDNDGIPDASSELTLASGTHATAIGPAAWATGESSIALGAGTRAFADNSVALGNGSVADRVNTVSVGSAGNERQIVNVAAGTELTDAVNVGQLNDGLKDMLGTANAYTDTAVATGGTQASAYTNNREAAIRKDMTQGDAQTLSAANAYTDSRIDELVGFDSQRVDHLENQVGVLDKRINRVGALSAALSLTAPDGRVSGANQFSMGVGHYRNQQALSVGYSRLVSPRAAVRIGAAFADGDSAAGVGFNVGW